MDGVVLNIQVGDKTVSEQFAENNEVIRPRKNVSMSLGTLREDTYLATPPFDPRPSQYACPFPSITWPAAPVIVMSVPEISIGLKELDEVVPKV